MKPGTTPSSKTGVTSIAAIPCFNTGSSIYDVVSKSKKHVSRVLVIDDGSTDNTTRQASAAGARVISHGRNRGYGAAIRSCFEAATSSEADILVILDGDGQHNPDDIPAIIAPITGGVADMTVGSRFLEGNIVVPGYRKFGIGLITLLFNLGSRKKVTDSQSGFRAYHRKLFSHLNLTEKGMSVSIEILEAARRKNAVIKEVPIICHYPPATFNMKAIWHGFTVAMAVAKIRFLYRLKASRNGKKVATSG